MRDLNMEYNSAREELIIPEYGRNVQKLVEYVKSLEDNEYRQAFAERIVDLMQQMHPQNRNLDDYREKLWKHIFRIANYDLEVLPPSGEKPQPEDARKRPDPVGYPNSDARFRHYGNNVQTLIKKAISMEEGPKRNGFVATIGAYMKLAYKTWNKEHYVSDEVIKGDLASLSNGLLVLDDNISLDNLTNANRKRRKGNNNGGSNSNGRDSNHHDRNYKSRNKNHHRRKK